MSLFQLKNIVLHSGDKSDFKIECDDLTYSDIEALSFLISKKHKFFNVFGVPRGGLKFADALKKYCIDDPHYPTLIVDDVLTTGRSMEEFVDALRKYCIDDPCYNGNPNVTYEGVVIFARGKCPEWIKPIFRLWE